MAKGTATTTAFDPFDAFVNAWGFHSAATALDERPETLVFQFPIWVNGALGLELFLKSLLMLRKVNPRPFGHNVRKLFDALTKADQTRIKRQLKFVVDKHKNKEKLKSSRIRLDANSILMRTNTVFEQMRYWHEKPPLPRDLSGRGADAGLDALASAVMLVLLDLQPDWHARFAAFIAKGEHPYYPSKYSPLPT